MGFYFKQVSELFFSPLSYLFLHKKQYRKVSKALSEDRITDNPCTADSSPAVLIGAMRSPRVQKEIPGYSINIRGLGRQTAESSWFSAKKNAASQINAVRCGDRRRRSRPRRLCTMLLRPSAAAARSRERRRRAECGGRARRSAAPKPAPPAPRPPRRSPPAEGSAAPDP